MQTFPADTNCEAGRKSGLQRCVDLERFWADNAPALRDPFSPAIPQFPLGLVMGYEAVFAELGYPFNLRRLEEDYDFARSSARAYNDKAEQIVGRRLLDEAAFDPSRRFPKVRPLEELFGCRNVWQSESWWALQAADSAQQLEMLLDRVERMDVEAEMFPPEWERACRRIFDQHGLRPFLKPDLRGPVTLATSVFGVENLIYLILDAPALAWRFRDAIKDLALQYYRICRRVSDPQRMTPGFSFRDDNCQMLTPAMYEQFGLPILQAIFAEFAPGPNDRRYQHSDSDMGHLLPVLAQANLNAVNFGPKVRFAQIRQHMPRAVVHGTLAPFTLMRNDEDAIIAEVRRDMDEARPTRGLVIETAGSVNDGSLLSSMRTVMWAIQTYGRLT
jgi:uroporphyrinogen decarboxylase